jgi:hypothetical protein
MELLFLFMALLLATASSMATNLLSWLPQSEVPRQGLPFVASLPTCTSFCFCLCSFSFLAVCGVAPFFFLLAGVLETDALSASHLAAERFFSSAGVEIMQLLPLACVLLFGTGVLTFCGLMQLLPFWLAAVA